MSAHARLTPPATARSHGPTGRRVELARYRVATGERVVVGQRVNGVVRLVDCPGSGHDRAYLVERGLEQDGYAALLALVTEYIAEAQRWNEVPMATSAVARRMRELGL